MYPTMCEKEAFFQCYAATMQVFHLYCYVRLKYNSLYLWWQNKCTFFCRSSYKITQLELNPSRKHIFEFMNILICLLSQSSIALSVNAGHKPFYEEYLKLCVWIYEWVRRITFHSCALCGANDENKQRGLIHFNNVKMAKHWEAVT